MILRFNIATCLNLNYDSPSQKAVVDNICLKLKAQGMEDDAWDETDVVQSGFKASGLKRYKIDMQSLLKTKSTVDESKETFESTGAVQGSANQLAMLEDTQVKIKIESQVVLDLIAIKAVLKTGEVKISAAVNELKRIKYHLDSVALEGVHVCVFEVVFVLFIKSNSQKTTKQNKPTQMKNTWQARRSKRSCWRQS